MYGAKAGANYEGLSIANLAPGLYSGFELVDIKIDKATKADGTTGKNIITFLFTGPNNGAHQHTEWEVLSTDKDAEKKADNLVLRIGHILRKFVPAEVVEANTATDWTSFTSWIMSVLGQSYKGVKLDLKIVGQVYDGKATSGFPGYLPFLKKTSEGGLSFSAKEAANNAEYYRFVAAKPDSEGGSPNAGAPTGGAAPADTDF